MRHLEESQAFQTVEIVPTSFKDCARPQHAPCGTQQRKQLERRLLQSLREKKNSKINKRKKIIIEPQVFAFAACIKRIKGVFRFVAKPPQKG